MEVSLSNADLAAILLRPQQQRLDRDRQTSLIRYQLESTKSAGESIQQLIVQATKLGGRLDVTG